jgi:ubiquinone/menaquinone biosynthesis C-methylase UbiE
LTQGNTERSKQKLARSFGAVAKEYERGRPGYPDDVTRWIGGTAPAVVLDVAAGTGKLTTGLQDLGHHVVGLDPSIEMLSQLSRQRPDIAVTVGRAERLPFGAGSFDALTVAQAFHWFDQTVAVAEFARVLRLGGHLAILWNFRDETVDWVAQLSRLIGSEGAEKEKCPYEPLPSTGWFESSTHRTFRFEQPLDRDLLVGLVRSRSYVATLPEAERRAVIAGVLRLCDEHPALAGRPEFSMPYRTEVFLAERIS